MPKSCKTSIAESEVLPCKFHAPSCNKLVFNPSRGETGSPSAKCDTSPGFPGGGETDGISIHERGLGNCNPHKRSNSGLFMPRPVASRSMSNHTFTPVASSLTNQRRSSTAQVGLVPYWCSSERPVTRSSPTKDFAATQEDTSSTPRSRCNLSDRNWLSRAMALETFLWAGVLSVVIQSLQPPGALSARRSRWRMLSWKSRFSRKLFPSSNFNSSLAKVGRFPTTRRWETQAFTPTWSSNSESWLSTHSRLDPSFQPPKTMSSVSAPWPATAKDGGGGAVFGLATAFCNSTSSPCMVSILRERSKSRFSSKSWWDATACSTFCSCSFWAAVASTKVCTVTCMLPKEEATDSWIVVWILLNKCLSSIRAGCSGPVLERLDGLPDSSGTSARERAPGWSSSSSSRWMGLRSMSLQGSRSKWKSYTWFWGLSHNTWAKIAYCTSKFLREKHGITPNFTEKYPVKYGRSFF